MSDHSMDWMGPRTESVLDVAASNIMQSVDEAKPMPKLAAWLLTLGLLGIVAGVDFVAPSSLGFSMFYLVPVLVAGMFLGRRPARAVALITTLAWAAMDFATGLSASPWILAWNSLMRIAFLLVVSEQFSALRAASARERQLARTDRLTGIANARVFFERVDHSLAVARREMRPFTLAYLDLDGFKAINDGYGHAEGDQVLRAAAMSISGCLRATDLVARLGGDEFGIVLPDTDSVAGRAAIERVFAELRQSMGGRWDVSSTVGMVTFLSAPESPEDAVKLADELMYRGKLEGRGRIESQIWPAENAGA